MSEPQLSPHVWMMARIMGIAVLAGVGCVVALLVDFRDRRGGY